MLAAGFYLPGFLMALAGAAGMLYGLRVLRPSVRDIEEYIRPAKREPGRFTNFMAGSGIVFALISLLIGMMLLLFGLALMALAP